MGKAFEKEIETIEDQIEKKVEALKDFKSDNKKLATEDVIPKSALNNDEAQKELDKIKEIEKYVDREKLVYKTKEYTHGLKHISNNENFW